MFEDETRIKDGDIVNYNGVFNLKGMIADRTWIGGRGSMIEASIRTKSNAGLVVTDLAENFTKDLKKSILKNDPVTIAVDRSNEIFKEMGLEVIVDRVATSTAEGTEIPYGRYNGKLYTAESIKKVEEFESRKTPEEVK